MNWNKHSNLVGSHAFLSASEYHWLNDDEEKIKQRYISYNARLRGTQLHDFAASAIRMKIKLPRNKQTLNAYVNDAIGFNMRAEQCLYYSDNCYGTADAICFRDNKLRIHDLKTGKTPASIKQLMIYAALFCLEYRIRPAEINIELRIYQNDDIQIYEPSTEEISMIMSKIVTYDKIINKMKAEV